jgi:hypothetical protein
MQGGRLAFVRIATAVLLLAAGVPLVAQVITKVPANFVFDGLVGEWEAMPPIEQLRYGDTPDGGYAIWAGYTDYGLIIAGRIRMKSWTLAMKPTEGKEGGPVEIWVSLVDSVDLPGLKYANPGYTCTEAASGNAQSLAKCTVWVQDQQLYRERLLRQFVRHWRVAPDGIREEYALPSFDQLARRQREALGFPRPAGLPETVFRTLPDGSSTFEVLVPWVLLPPTNRLNLERMRVRLLLDRNPELEVPSFGDLAGYDSSQPIPHQRMKSIAVSPPIVTRITTCAQPLSGRNDDGEDRPAYYFLNSAREVDSAFLFENEVSPFGFPPQVDEVSPGATYQRFFSQALGPDEYLCGPYLSYRNGSIGKIFPFRLDAPLQPPFAVHDLTDGTRLIRVGPAHLPLPRSWHHAWDLMSMTIFALTPSHEVVSALKLEFSRDTPAGYEIEISDDWRTIKEFKTNRSGQWSSETYCLQGHLYRSCGKDPNSAPPKRRVLTPEGP